MSCATCGGLYDEGPDWIAFQNVSNSKVVNWYCSRGCREQKLDQLQDAQREHEFAKAQGKETKTASRRF